MNWQLYSRSKYHMIPITVENTKREERKRTINYAADIFLGNDSNIEKAVGRKFAYELLQKMVDFSESFNMNTQELEENVQGDMVEAFRIRNRVEARKYRWQNRNGSKRFGRIKDAKKREALAKEFALPGYYPVITDEDYQYIAPMVIRMAFMDKYRTDFSGNPLVAKYYLVEGPTFSAIIRAEDEIVAIEYFDKLADTIGQPPADTFTLLDGHTLWTYITPMYEEGSILDVETNLYLRSIKPGIVFVTEV